MSMHFAPQWVKPIKPTALAQPSSDATSQGKPANSSSAASQTPFPALSASSISNASSAPTPTAAMSYSRVTHTPTTPGFPTDGSYFPSSGDATSGGNPKPHPFRYSRDQILALWDEDKVKETPFELVEMRDNGGVLVSKTTTKPVGLRDLSEAEKKILATSIHPPMPNRRVLNHASNPAATDNTQQQNGTPNSRRSGGVTRDPAQPNGRGFSGFGRGEGGALGGGAAKPGVIGGGMINTGDTKIPGVLGGGFGGVKRLGRTRMESAGEPVPGESPRVATGPWRNSRTASGNFEGVLGFGGPQTAVPQPSNTTAPEAEVADAPHDGMPNTAPATNGWREKQDLKLQQQSQQQQQQEQQKKDREDQPAHFGNGGGPGWGTGQRKWRQNASLVGVGEGEKSLNHENTTSTMATPSATPLPERDATVIDSVTPPRAQEDAPGQSEAQTAAQREDLGAIQWYYRDPNGQEQGPFTGTQMHDWYSHSYFTDDLPLRRSSETSFHSLADLKIITGNAVQPFLSPVRPRNLPPNLPIPVSALQAPPPPQQPAPNSLIDHFQHLGMQGAQPAENRSHPSYQQFQQPRDDPSFPPNPFQGQQYPPQYATQVPGYHPAPGQPWGSIGPQPVIGARFNNGPYGNVGIPSPLAGPSPYAPQSFSSPIGGPIAIPRGPNNDFFSPGIGAGAIPASPWGIPPIQQQQSFGPGPGVGVPQQQQQQQQQQQIPAWQQIPHEQSYQPTSEQEQVETSADEPSYFPDVDHIVQAMDEETAMDDQLEAIVQAEEEEHREEAAELAEEVEASPETAPATVRDASPVKAASSAAPAPAQNAWAKTTPAPKPAPSTTATPAKADAAPAPTPAASASDAKSSTPAPSTLPAKPAASRKTSTVLDLRPAVSTPEKPAAPAKAPWAVAKDDKEAKASPSGPSLREIQDAEAKVADARKQALAEARANAAPSPALSASDEMPQSISWGLPSQGSKLSIQTASTSSTPTLPVWGATPTADTGASAAKKTLKQIQEEEEKRKAKAAAVSAQARPAVPGSAAASSGAKRGYADLAATSSASTAPGWTTVGTAGKATPGAAPTPAAAVRSAVAGKSATSTPVKTSVTTSAPSSASIAAKSKPNTGNGSNAEDTTAPSVEFVRWTKQALTGLNVNLDEFIQMLLTFPIDPPASSRSDVLEIISDSVYANSSTLDGRRFAQEFFTRRKADVAATKAAAASGVRPVSKISSLADVLKAQPKAPSVDLGFKIVKAKGKKK